MPKPRTFIGSSSERLDVARDLATLLGRGSHVIPWDKPVGTGRYTLESILETANGCDFGVFVFGPDDVLHSRSKTYWATRDNVVFELGLFMGRFGRERSLLLVPAVTNHKMLTDLLGLTYETYLPSGAGRKASLKRAAGRLLRTISKPSVATHTGWNELLWLRHQLASLPLTARLTTLDALTRFGKRSREWRESDVEALMRSIETGVGRAAANTAFFGMHWCGIVSFKKPFQKYWFENDGVVWRDFREYVHISDRGLVLLNGLRN